MVSSAAPPYPALTVGNDADPPTPLAVALDRLRTQRKIQAKHLLTWRENCSASTIPLGPWTEDCLDPLELTEDALSKIKHGTTAISEPHICRRLTRTIMLAEVAWFLEHDFELSGTDALRKVLAGWVKQVYPGPSDSKDRQNLFLQLQGAGISGIDQDAIDQFEAGWLAQVQKIRAYHDPNFPKPPQPETPSAPQALASDPATQTTQNLSVREQLAIIFTQHPALRDYLADELRPRLSPPPKVGDIDAEAKAVLDYMMATEVGLLLLELANYQNKALEAGKTTAAQELHWLVRWFLPLLNVLPQAKTDGPILELSPTTWAMVERAVAQDEGRAMRVCLGEDDDGYWVVGQTALLTADISPTRSNDWLKGLEEQLGVVLRLMGRGKMTLGTAMKVARRSQQTTQNTQFSLSDDFVPFYVILAKKRGDDKSDEDEFKQKFPGLRLVYLPDRSLGDPEDDVVASAEEALNRLLKGSKPRILR